MRFVNAKQRARARLRRIVLERHDALRAGLSTLVIAIAQFEYFQRLPEELAGRK